MSILNSHIDDFSNKVCLGDFTHEIKYFLKVIEKCNFEFPKVLIIGCGDGSEAYKMYEMTGWNIFGIDAVEPKRFKEVNLIKSEAENLPFEDNTFDIVYSNHVLEYIIGYKKVLDQIIRVIKPNGVCYLTFPNKARLIGYVGARGLNLFSKVRANFRDWNMRIAGKWNMESGAHCGFDYNIIAKEFEQRFNKVEYLRNLYYESKYGADSILLKLV